MLLYSLDGEPEGMVDVVDVLDVDEVVLVVVVVVGAMLRLPTDTADV